MLFKFSSVLYFSKYHDSGRLQAAYSFSCFQGPCRLWRYLFLLLYMWQSTLALPPLSLLRFVWLNFGLPFSGPCSQDFLVFSLSRAKEVFYASLRICKGFGITQNLLRGYGIWPLLNRRMPRDMRYRIGEENGIREKDDRRSGCGIVMKKERDCGSGPINSPYPPAFCLQFGD